MKKQDFINAVHTTAELDISRKLTGEIIDTTFTELTNILNNEGGKFSYPGFGTFSIKARAERQGINPKTKVAITIPASNTVGFKVASGWKTVLKNNL